MSNELHISSLLVHINPEKSATIETTINLFEGAEFVTVSEQGKAIVLIEAPNQKVIMEVIDHINELDGVLSTGLVYHEVEKIDA